MILINASLTSFTPEYRRFFPIIDYPCPPSRRRLTHTPPSSLRAAFPTNAIRSSTYQCRDHVRLDTALDLPRRAVHLARLDGALDGARELEVMRKEHRECCMSHLSFILITSVLNVTSQGSRILNITPNHPPSLSLRLPAFSQGKFTHNTAGATIAAYTKGV